MEKDTTGKVKIGDQFYTWEYDEKSQMFEAWNQLKVKVAEQKITPEGFEKMDVASFIKHGLGTL